MTMQTDTQRPHEPACNSGAQTNQARIENTTGTCNYDSLESMSTGQARKTLKGQRFYSW